MSEETNEEQGNKLFITILKWIVVLATAGIILLIPVPNGVEPKAWHLLAIFVATIVGSIVRPISGGAVVLLGVTAIAVTNTLPVKDALSGYADPFVWLVLAAFMLSRGMIKTGLGRRIAFLFIRFLGRSSLGLGYSLIMTDYLLAAVIPSTGARAGGVVFPIAKSITEAYDSRPGPTEKKLGAFLMVVLYQCNVLSCTTFLTGQASNPAIAGFALKVTGIELTYSKWLIGAIVPSLISLLVIPLLIYRLFPPEVKETPAASDMASEELKAMGKMKSGEWLMLIIFLSCVTLWLTKSWNGIDYAVVALLGMAALLLSNVLSWKDVISERDAWDVFIWYGGLVQMAYALSKTGIMEKFANSVASVTSGWTWGFALIVLLLIYFYIHYGFASITAHSAAMYIPFLSVIIAAGAPPILAVLALAYASNLSACLTHYGTTSAPIYFGAGYVKQRTWWLLGLTVSIPFLLIWTLIGFVWWKILGWI